MKTPVFTITAVALAVATSFSSTADAKTAKLSSEQKQMLNLTQTGVDKAWLRGYTGAGVTIAILDSGFDTTHTDFTDKIIAAKNFNTIVEYNSKNATAVKNGFLNNLQTNSDVTWALHGTNMASVAAGKLDNNGAVGVAPDANLLLAQVGQGLVWNKSSNKWVDSTGGIQSQAWINALTWAEQNGAAVANMSFGLNYDKIFQTKLVKLSDGTYQASSNYGSMYGHSNKDLMAFAGASKTMVIVAAAGNQALPYAMFPGAFATQVDANGGLVLGGRLLIVGSVSSRNTISSFSNKAGHICTNIQNGVCQDPYQVKDFFVVAPGEAQIASLPNQFRANDTFGAVSGTSPAAAYVSGGVALIKQAWPQLKAHQIVKLITSTATDLGAKGVDEVYGHGLVNFDRATQPSGGLSVADFQVKQGMVTGGTYRVANTHMTTNNVIRFDSNLLRSVQSVDEIGRHYSVDMTRSMRSSSEQINHWLGFGANYTETPKAPINKDLAIKVINSNIGSAVEVFGSTNFGTVSLQLGGMKEQNGFLGNYGAGALSIGSSSTGFMQLSAVSSLTKDITVFGSYGQGFTKTKSVDTSMIALSSDIVSDTAKLGINKSNLTSDNDSLQIGFALPLAVQRGSANVTAVVDYNFNEYEEGNVTADSVVKTETVNLSKIQNTELAVNYIRKLSTRSHMAVNFVGTQAQSQVAVKFISKF